MEKIYVIRKVVRAPSIKEALKREPSGKILDIIQTTNNKDPQYIPAIGFAPPTDIDDDDA